MHDRIINDVPKILNLGHAKSSLLQIGTQLVCWRGLKYLSDMVEDLFASLAKYQDLI